MISMPLPLIDFIPKELHGTTATLLAEVGDQSIDEAVEDVRNIERLKDPGRCPSDLLPELADMLAASLREQESERTSRVKVRYAVATQKKKGSFSLTVKPILDSITGASSSLITSVGGGDWVLTGDGKTPGSYGWGSLGGDGSGDGLGLVLFGSGNEIGIKGNVYIDLGVGSLGASVIDEIVDELKDHVPAYYIVHIGYLDPVTGYFEYATMG